jgi:indolepyruvate decarboxylase
VKDDSKISIRSLFGELNRFITEDMVVISDIGDCLFGAVDLKIHRRTEFLSPAYYASMGFGVLAALGAQTAAPHLRPVVLVGDGAFQMTGMELSTCVRHGLNPIVVVLNNHGYSTERQIMDGPFNDVNEWAFHRVPELLGSGWGFTVETVGDLRQALQASLANRDSFSILDVNLDAYDMSPALERLGERMGKNIKS